MKAFSSVTLSLCFFFLSVWGGKAQETYKFVPAQELSLKGKISTATPGVFVRLDTAQVKRLPKRVQQLSRNTAGIYVDFISDASSIRVKWVLDNFREMYNMTPLAINGLDLYAWNGDRWQYVASGKPVDSINERNIITNLDGKPRRYRLHFPLYTGVESLEIGVPKGAVLKKINPELLPEKKIVIYGSSITQGASASRPGLAYPAILARIFKAETFNLGFSGAGKMELEMAKILGKVDADLFILDCVPNPSPEQIRERTQPFVKTLRISKPKVPILMVESVYRERAHWDSEVKKRVEEQNSAFRQAYEGLLREGLRDLYYISTTELIGVDNEATIDGTHLNDLGQMRMAERLGKEIKKIFSAE